MHARQHPVVIQGGMGVGVSSWQLARAVSQGGGLGVISGTAMDAVLARRLQDGDPGEHVRRALAAFPSQPIAQRIIEKYFIDGGKAGDAPYRPVPKLTIESCRAGRELQVAANFCEVWLAKEGHDGLVGINCLEKIQMATPAALLGAILAGVDYVLMGAGIPREIPHLLGELAAGRVGQLHADVAGGGDWTISIDPADVLGVDVLAAVAPSLRRPQFLAIISADALAGYLARDPEISPDGFVVEGPTAGGHSAPPRGKLQLDADGDPIYGPRDDVNLAKMTAVGLPFWLAGGYGTPDQVAAALESGAVGVQVGSLFALAHESGLTEANRALVRDRLSAGDLSVHNDPRASPTGFPFKSADLEGTAGDHDAPERVPLCDLSYLRTPYLRVDGTVGYRCPSEPAHMYLKKGGKDLGDTIGRKCLCNGLMATIGLGQTRKDGYVEQPLITLGQDLAGERELLAQHPDGYSATEALRWLLSKLPALQA